MNLRCAGVVDVLRVVEVQGREEGPLCKSERCCCQHRPHAHGCTPIPGRCPDHSSPNQLRQSLKVGHYLSVHIAYLSI